MGPLHGFGRIYCLACFAVNAHVYIQAVLGKQRLAGMTTESVRCQVKTCLVHMQQHASSSTCIVSTFDCTFAGVGYTSKDPDQVFETALCGDPAMKLSPEKAQERAELGDYIAQKGKAFPLQPGHIGTHGTSIFVKTFPYIEPLSFFVIPPAHALLLGLEKDFIKRILGLPNVAGQFVHSYTCLSNMHHDTAEKQQQYLQDLQAACAA